MSLQELIQQALHLEMDERALLAERLLASLEDLSLQEAERLWADEASNRLRDYQTGRTQAVPAAEVHARAEKLLVD